MVWVVFATIANRCGNYRINLMRIGQARLLFTKSIARRSGGRCPKRVRKRFGTHMKALAATTTGGAVMAEKSEPAPTDKHAADPEAGAKGVQRNAQ